MSRLRFVEAPPAEAARFLAFVLGWRGEGELPVFVDGSAVPTVRLPCEPGVGGVLWRVAQKLDLERSVQVEVGLPLCNGVVVDPCVLWAWCRSLESTARAARFRPAPALVLRFGKGADRLLLWALREPTPSWSVEAENERVSYALHAPRTLCAPEKLRVPVPGTFLRVGRERPAPVLVTRMELTDYARRDVTGALKAPPPRDAWRQRRAS